MADIVPIIEISQKVGIPIEVVCFIGNMPRTGTSATCCATEEAVTLAMREGLPSCT